MAVLARREAQVSVEQSKPVDSLSVARLRKEIRQLAAENAAEALAGRPLDTGPDRY
ncbi:hypothetical protein [Sandarakinorhabdus sp.]|uniref:hypothetical protein n=1 Tax=Sandarakinorhabdus sp. TaxID=1916663 RepID=UPI00286E70C8|nr:hypothetical protein [Sandarakinorhabdus sp.]